MAKKRADLVEGTGVGGWIGARRATDRALVDVDDLVDLICAFNGAMLAWNAFVLWIDLTREAFVEDLVDEGTLAAAADAGDTGQHAEWKADGEIFKIVSPCADNLEHAFLVDRTARFWNGDALATGEISAGDGILAGRQLLLACQPATTSPPPAPARGPMSTMKSGGAHGVFVVLDDDDGVAKNRACA